MEEEELEGLEVADSFDAHGLDDIFATRFSSPIQLSRSFQLICYNVNCSVLYYYVELKNNESKRTYDKMNQYRVSIFIHIFSRHSLK